MRITIFGATGLLGKALMREWKDDDVTGFASADGDIRDEKQVLNLVQRAPPRLDRPGRGLHRCRRLRNQSRPGFRRELPRAINVARAAKQHGSRLLFLSTDYVFDGTKTTPYATDDPRSPRSSTVSRRPRRKCNWVRFCPSAASSALPGSLAREEMLSRYHSELAETRPELEVVGDQRGSPTYHSIWPAPCSPLPPGNERHCARH